MSNPSEEDLGLFAWMVLRLLVGLAGGVAALLAIGWALGRWLGVG